MTTVAEYRTKMNKTEVAVTKYSTKAVADEVAFAGVKSGDWDMETFEIWASKVRSDSYADGDADRSYSNAM